jgi:hypothetical protein
MENNIIETTVVPKTQFIENIKRWVLIDSQMKIVNEKTKKMREMKRDSSEQICKYVTERNLTNNKIGISDGELRFYEKKEYSPLTFGYIEKCLGELITDKKQVDYIIQHLKDNREITTSIDIKRTYSKPN